MAASRFRRLTMCLFLVGAMVDGGQALTIAAGDVVHDLIA